LGPALLIASSAKAIAIDIINGAWLDLTVDAKAHVPQFSTQERIFLGLQGYGGSIVKLLAPRSKVETRLLGWYLWTEPGNEVGLALSKKMVLLFRGRSSIAAPMNINEFPEK
jgi:hypothetical protein